MKNAWACVVGLWALMVALTGCGAEPHELDEPTAGQLEAPLINGGDNRIEPAETSDWSLWHRPRSIAAVMSVQAVNVPSPYPPPPKPPWAPVTFNAPTLQQAHNLCDGQRFATQLTPAYCTAVLIDDGLVLTDGRCVMPETCADTRFVFDYWRHHDGDPESNDLYKVYKCQSVVVRQTSPSSYAIVRLDRSTKNGQHPAAIRKSRAPLSQGIPLVALGHAHGTSLKLSPGGIVLNQGSPGATTFELSNDGTLMGGRGSGIFHQETGELVGIWTNPNPDVDYEAGPPGSTPPGCNVVKTCPESDCGGGRSSATYVGVALDAYCAANTNPRLCEPRNTLEFSASGTPYQLAGSVFLEPGATLDYGTCGIPGSSAVGDTTISVRGPYWTEYASNDDGGGSCGLASRATYTTPSLTGGLFYFRPGCYQEGTCSGTVAYTVSGPTGGSLSYTAASTNSAIQGTRNFSISLRQGETLDIGTCGVENGNFTGDTMLVLKSGATVVASNDDACGGLGSQVTYTAPSAQTLTLQAGCFGQKACSGTVAWTKGVSYLPFSAANTNDGAQNTVNKTIRLVAGDRVTVGTCGLMGASYAGDPVVSLFLGGTRVSFNDNDCGGAGSRLTFRAATSADYSVRVGCSLGTSCSGTAVIRVTPPDTFNGTVPFVGSNTGSATTQTSPLFLWLRAGDLLSVGTCPNLVPGATATGDTFLRAFGPDNLQLWSSDNNCPGGNSSLSARTDLLITPDKAGPQVVYSGCFGNTSCSGDTAFQLR